MLKKKTWSEFRNTGLVLFVNTFLHIFGWAIVFNVDDGEIKEVYPARTKFRGFDENTQTEAYKKISTWMKEFGEELYKEANE